MEKTQSRQHHLDALRGIAAVIVLVVHYFAAFSPYAVFGNKGHYIPHFDWEDIFFIPPFGFFLSGRFAICLFFILSGYVLSYSHLGEKQHWRMILGAMIKRPIRLGGLVWFSIIVSSLFWYLGLYYNGAAAEITGSAPWFNHYYSENFDVVRMFSDLTTSSFSRGKIYDPPLWTIKIELYGSILVYLFVLLVGGFRYRMVIAFLLLILFMDSLYQGFWIGVIIADLVKNHQTQNTFRPRPKFLLSSMLLLLFMFFSSYPNYVTQEFLKGTIYQLLPDDKNLGGGYPMLSAILLFAFVIINNKVKTLLNRPVFKFLGEISYSLYVLHFLVLCSFSSWLFLMVKDYFGYGMSFLVVFLSSVPVIILMAYLANKYIDQPSIVLARCTGAKLADTIIAVFSGIFRGKERGPKKI